MQELLRELVLADAPPGRENEVRDIVVRELEPISDELTIDVLGNVIARKSGVSDKTFMLIAHQDEDWALMVKHIDKSGFLRFTRLVGHRWNFLGQRVTIHGVKGKRIGVIGLKAPHLIPVEIQEQGYKPEFDKMFIDTGARTKEIALNQGLAIGQFVTAHKRFEELANGRLVGNCFDDRAGLAVMIEVMRQIHEITPAMNLVAVASVQEELGTRGAPPAAFSIQPDYAIALDVAPTGDQPNLSFSQVPVELGKGPTLLIADQNGATSTDLNSWVTGVAENHHIPLQRVTLRPPIHYGTDAAAVELTRKGCKTTALLIPTRYFHTTNSVIDKADLEVIVQLLVESIYTFDRLLEFTS